MDDPLQIDGTEGAEYRIKARLGIVAVAGFQAVPNLLLTHQFVFGLTSEELNVYLNILMHWHHPNDLPYVHSDTIAARMGVSRRAVQRGLKGLLTKGYILKVKPKRRSDLTRYDVRPILKRLEPYARQRIALVGERSFDDLPPEELEAHS